MNYSTSGKLTQNTKNFLNIKYYNLLKQLQNKSGIFYGWGRKTSGFKAIELAKKNNTSFVLLEDGFIRSLGLGVDGSPSFSLVEDNIGIYYDATAPSKLENILNTYDFANDEPLMEKAREAMALIKEHHISKYNNAPKASDDFLQDDNKPKVLIVAQTNGDASLEYGLGNVFATQKIIDDAIKENPDASVYIKIHPDVLSGKKKSDITADEIPKSCKILDEDVNPISLLKHFDKIYTKTSGMGMEALILGKDVVCYGMPYYAGWGNVKLGVKSEELGVDKYGLVERVMKRRDRKLTVEELFAGAYILYTRYYNPYRNRPSNILDTIHEIILQRKKVDADIKNKILALGDSHIRVFEHFFFKYLTPKSRYEICYVPGATAYGIGNLHSQTSAYKKFLDTLKVYNYESIVVTLGEVDTSHTLWGLAARTEKPVEDMLKLSIERYQRFLQELVKYAPVTVLSTSFPTVNDVAKCDDSISGIRKKMSVSQVERTKLTEVFNKQIKIFVENEQDMYYLDFNPVTLNTESGTVKSWLLNGKNTCDHHYKRWIYAIMIIIKRLVIKS